MPIYFDHNATTPIDPRVLEAMQPYFSGPYGNPSSVHRYGRAAREAIEAARTQVAAMAGAQPAELIWTSGATESDNFAIKGFLGGFPAGNPADGSDASRSRRRARLLYSATEHPAVLETAEFLRSRGWPVDVIRMKPDGLIDWPALEAQLEDATAPPLALAAVMLANNETGVIQDVGRVAGLVHAAGGRLLVDAVQAAGKMPIDFAACGADLMSLSAHKLYGPKGVGALLVKSDVELTSLMHGGGQEKGLRGGTGNVAGIVGFGAAAELAMQELAMRAAKTRALRERLEAGLQRLPGSRIFGESSPRLPNTVQFAIVGWEGEALLMALDRKGIAVSSGSACASGTGEPSHVLLGMGFSRDIAFGAIRVSFGPDNTTDEVDRLLAVLGELVVSAVAA